MTESHAEDAPLLGGGEVMSPGECASSQWQGRESKETIRTPWPPDAWADKLQVPAGDEKTVKAQSSMDSGCDCDTSDTVSPHDLQGSSVLTPPPSASSTTTHNQPMSPLSPSQPGGSGLPSPGLPNYYNSEGTHSTSVCDNNSKDGLVPPSATSLPHSHNNNNNICVAPGICRDPMQGTTTLAPVHSSSGSMPSGVCLSQGACSNPVQGNYFEKKIWPEHPPPQQNLSQVTFRIEGDEDEEEDVARRYRNIDAIESASYSGSEPGEDFRNIVFHNGSKPFPRVPSYNKSAGVLSSSSSTASMPMCRICHLPQGDGIDSLISPCRCAGTMQFIHQGCLMRWLEISSKRSKRAPACELCQYQFNRHKKFRLRHWKLPPCSRMDKILHSIFLVCLIIMATCATITAICFKQDQFKTKKDEAELTQSEIVTLTCGVLFFVAFFVAMYVEVKARDTLYRLFCRFFYMNETWYIDEYDKRKDTQINHNHAPV